MDETKFRTEKNISLSMGWIYIILSILLFFLSFVI
ncbi:hypothetical protein [Xylanivirga thermophila]